MGLMQTCGHHGFKSLYGISASGLRKRCCAAHLRHPIMKPMGDLAYTIMLVGVFVLLSLAVRCANRERSQKG